MVASLNEYKDAGTYCRCMEEIKIRIGVVSSLLSGKIPIQREDVLGEFICVQLRKVLELIAFGSLTANKDAYAEAHRDFATHWNAKKLLSKLEHIHPEFYPRPIAFGPSDDKRIHHFEYVQDGFLTRGEFVILYRHCGEVLHARNPFRTPTTIKFEGTMQEWVTRIQQLLKFHLMRLAGSEDVWVVQMEHPDDGKVHAIIGQPSDKAPNEE